MGEARRRGLRKRQGPNQRALVAPGRAREGLREAREALRRNASKVLEIESPTKQPLAPSFSNTALQLFPELPAGLVEPRGLARSRKDRALLTAPSALSALGPPLALFFLLSLLLFSSSAMALSSLSGKKISTQRPGFATACRPEDARRPTCHPWALGAGPGRCPHRPRRAADLPPKSRSSGERQG